jgi:hypothetical protein
MNDLKGLIKRFLPFAQEKMGFDRPPKLFLRQDAENGADPLGKTGFYDPQAESITLFVSERHPKDILRSLAHELMHHTQKCNGDFDNTESQGMGEQGYAQNNTHMRTMEIQAYQASIVFRDWEDSLKETIYYEHLQKGDKKMSIKDWKNGEISTLLTEKWGFNFTLNNLNEGKSNKTVQEISVYDKDEPEEDTKGSQKKRFGKQDENLEETDAHPDWGGGKDEKSHTRPGEKDYTGHKGDESSSSPDDADFEDDDDRSDLEGKANRVLADLHDVMTAAGLDVNLTADVSGGDADGEEEEFELDERTKRESENNKARGSGGRRLKPLEEDSGEDEAWHDWENEHSDDNHIREIEHHLRALKGDRDHDRHDAEHDDDKYEDEGYSHRNEGKKSKISEAQLRRIATQVMARLKEAKKNG